MATQVEVGTRFEDEIDQIRQAARLAGRQLTAMERDRIDDLIVARAAAEREWLAQSRAAYVREQRDYWVPRERAKLRAALRPSAIFLGLLGILVGSGVLLAASPSERLVQPLTILFILSGWIACLCIHEFGHALAGYLGGDRSVIGRGYLSLDPRNYTHPLLSIVMPVAFLLMGGIGLPGGAVLVERDQLRSRRWDLAVSVGGPLGTALCLLLLSTPFLLAPDAWMTEGNIFLWAALAGLVKLLAIVLILNLLPIPPLDGFRILAYWLPEHVAERAFALGWMPIFFLYMLLARGGPAAEMFWSAGDSIATLLQLPDGFAEYAIWQLSLRG
jgi:Zn-dependent protease